MSNSFKAKEELAYRDLDLEVDGKKAFAILLDYVDVKPDRRVL